jgi:uncharacterized lipoprotein YmbA
MRARRAAALALSGLVSQAGCSFWRPRPDQTRFYVLTEASAPPSATRAPAALVALGPVHLAAYLDRPQLVTRVAPNEVVIAEAERWAEPLDGALAATLARNLARALGSDAVLPPGDGAAHAAFEAALAVSRCERISAREVELAVRWTIRDDSGRVRLTRESRLRQATAGSGAGDAVAALSQALAALSVELAAALRELR